MANEFKIKKGLIVTGASGGTVVDIQGSQGQLFSVTDDLSGSIFAVSDISGVPILDVNSSSTVNVDGTLNVNNKVVIQTGTTYAQATDYLYIGGDDLGGGDAAIYLGNRGNGTGYGWRFYYAGIGSGNSNNLVIRSENLNSPVDAVTFNQDGFAAFANKVQAAGWFQGNGATNTLYSNVTAGVLLQTAGSTQNNNDSKIFFRNSGTTVKHTFDTYNGDATFVGQGFSSATSSGDASSTLTTKGYVDGLITGATIYRGAWQAGISATSSAATTASTTLTVTAAILDVDGNTPDLVGAVVTGAGITGIVKVASVTSSTVYVLDTAITATATAYIFSPIYGAPDLSGVTETSGYYYICSEAGSATPNGANSEPNTWNVGDWCIYNDVSGTGQWQKIDNSSVLSGAGTGQTVALWEGPSSVTDSDTLGNAPITVSGNNTTFAGNITALTGAGSGNITVGRNTNEKTIIDVGDQVNSITAYQDSDGNATHNFTLNRVFGGTGANDFIIQKDGTAQFTLDTSANALFAGSVTVDGVLYLENSSTTVQMTGNTSGNFTIDNNSGQISFQANGSTVNSLTISSSLLTLNEVSQVNNTLQTLTAMRDTDTWDGAVLRLNSTDTVDTTGFQGMRFATSTANNYGWRFGANRSTSGRGSLRFYEHNNTVTGIERFTIQQGGNVGIGTNAPFSLLEISQQLSAAATIDYPYTITSRDDANSINQVGGEGVGIKFRIAGNDATTPGNSIVGASIAAIRESASDTDSSTGLGFFVTQNDEVLDEALRIDHDKNANFLSNVDIADSLDVTNSIDLGTQVWKTYTNTAAKLNVEVAGGNAINIFNTQENAAFLNFIDSQSDGSQYANLNFNSSGTNALIINNMGYDTTISNAGVWTFPNNVNATTFIGNLQGGHTSGTISSGVTAITQPNATDNTTIATTAYVVNKIAELPAGLQFLGTWNADTNTPTLATGGGERSEGTATTVTANKLIDSAATFTTAPAVVVGDRVRVVTPNGPEFALVTVVDSATQLTLASDIVTAIGETYILEVAPFLPEGSYYIVSNDGATDLNGITDWKVGDWAVASSTNVWQKIDNSSVLDGQGTGQTIPLWSGSGNSNTLTNSNITQTSSTNVKIASSVHITDSTQYTSGQASIEVVKLQRINTGGDIKASTEGHVSMWATDSNNDTEWARMSWVNDNDNDGGLESEGALCFWTSQEGTLNRAMYIDHNQNVGIGTTSPTHLLNLSESDSNSVQLVIDNTNTTDAGTETSEIRFRHYRSYVAGQNDAGEIIVGKEQAWDAAGDRNSYMAFGTRKGSDAVVEKMRITSGGKVGIGTDNPDSELDIRSDSSTEPVVLKLGNAVASGDNDVIISQLSTFIDNSNTAANELGRIQVQNGAGSHDDGIMSFWTRDGINNVDAARRMTIDGLGQVGIGIDSPLNTLSIESTNGTLPLIKIRNKTNGGGAAIEFNDNGTSATTQNGTLTYYHADGSSQGGGASFWLEAQPDTVLVVGNGTNTGRVIVGGNSTAEVGYGFYDDVNTGMFKPANHQLGFATNGTNRLTISTIIQANSPIKTILGTAAIPALQIGDSDSGFYDSGANLISVSLGGVQSATFHDGGRFQAVSSVQAGDDTNTAGASRAGAIRYRTGTEYVEVTGTELVVNGDFATTATWTTSGTVAISGGTANWTNAVNGAGFFQAITFTANAYYKCEVTVSNYSTGTFRFRYPGISSPRVSANGTYSFIIEADQSQNATLFLQGEVGSDTNVNFSIDNVSVMEVTEEDASYADMCMQTGASTYEWVNIVKNTY